MKLTKLQESALPLFAARGFDGTSMSQIAEETGIKKASIYAHVKGKEELYLNLLIPIIEEELDYTVKTFAKQNLTDRDLYQYLESFGTRMKESPYMPFLLRAMFLPPEGIYSEVMELVKKYVNDMESILKDAFTRFEGKYDAVVLAEAYFGIVDSLQAEILYGSEDDFKRRLSSMWSIFKLALQ